MPQSEINEYIQTVMERTDWTQARLNRELDDFLARTHDRSIINKVLKGRRKLTIEELLAIEQLSGLPAPSMSDSDLIRPVPVPLISWVSAGNLILPEGVANLEDAPRVALPGLDPDGEWIALKVEGDSMDRISPPESIIFVNTKDKRLVPNALYVITTEEGEATYKRYRDGKFSPVSTNKSHKPLKMPRGASPKVIGRVRRTLLSM